MLFPYFVYIAHLEALFSRKNLCSWKNQKSLVKEKGKKNRPKEERKSTILSRKEKKLRCDSDWYWRSSTLTSRFWTKKSPSNQSLPCYIMLKTRFPFPYASTGLDTKTLTIASNRNSESRRSIRCLAPQHIFRFFHFCHGFPLPLTTWLIFVSSSSTLHWAIEFKKKKCLQWVTFPGKSWSIVIDASRSRCHISLRFKEAPGVTRIVCEPLWAKISHLILEGLQPLWKNL